MTDELTDPDSDSRAVELWRRYQETNGAKRRSRAELNTLRERLSAILVDQYHRMMASGGFDLWLRSCGIARATAYRLIHLAELAKELANPPAPPPPPIGSHYTMLGDTLMIKFSLPQSEGVRRALGEIEKRGHKIDVAKLCLDLAVERVPAHLRDPILRLYNLPLSKFPPARRVTGEAPFDFSKDR